VLFPVPFEKGKRYWFAWSSRHDYLKHPHWILGWWPESDRAATALKDAVAAGRFARQPHLELTTGVTYDHAWDAKSKTGRLRGTRAGKVLWDVALEGEPADDLYGAWSVNRRDGVSDLEHAPAAADAMFLGVATRATLDAANPYGLPAGDYTLTNWYELQSGWRAAVEVSPKQPGGQWLVRTYDRTTARPTWERETRWVPNPGPPGPATGGWVLQVVRTYDPKTGRKTSEEHFRVEGSTPVKIRNDE